ncbi:protein of unknown function (plasmid) [Rhodovastum atsumiense]|uniref:hypothetical protein n=1 Tax=Rhodovastum atsumiense TaxID=504468 RepID=UPI00193B3887|nr:hypothetical protein [Rhodovastum atsumiense]CAH2606523.1 protein of unknown function [Rhodovastum atsumiense]
MAYHLVVTTPFGDRQRGDTITDQAEVARILAGEQADKVVKVQVPVETPAAVQEG